MGFLEFYVNLFPTRFDLPILCIANPPAKILSHLIGMFNR